MEDVPNHGKGVGLADLSRSLPTQAILQTCCVMLMVQGCFFTLKIRNPLAEAATQSKGTSLLSWCFFYLLQVYSIDHQASMIAGIDFFFLRSSKMESIQ